MRESMPARRRATRGAARAGCGVAQRSRAAARVRRQPAAARRRAARRREQTHKRAQLVALQQRPTVAGGDATRDAPSHVLGADAAAEVGHASPALISAVLLRSDRRSGVVAADSTDFPF
jgi:hypothetical protein